MVTAAKAAPDLHAPNQFFFLCKHGLQQSPPSAPMLEQPAGRAAPWRGPLELGRRRGNS